MAIQLNDNLLFREALFIFLCSRMGYKTKYQLIKEREAPKITALTHTGIPALFSLSNVLLIKWVR